MRGFGRSGRGPGPGLVKLVRHTAQQRLARGEPIHICAFKANARLEQTRTRRAAQRQRLTLALTTALSHHDDLRTQATRLPQGQQRSHGHLVHADALTLAPLRKGTSHGPAQLGTQPGSASAPATGLIWANLVPQGPPSDPRYGRPVRDKVQSAIDRVRTGPTRQMHSVASALGRTDPCWRQALHERGILTVGLPQTMEPITPQPSAQDVLPIRHEAGLNRQRTPHQVHVACARGSSRPVVERPIASVLARGAGLVRSPGLEGAVLHQRMTVLAHNGAVMVRIRPHHLSKRSQQFRRFRG
jgi:hypothetical protein